MAERDVVGMLRLSGNPADWEAADLIESLRATLTSLRALTFAPSTGVSRVIEAISKGSAVYTTYPCGASYAETTIVFGNKDDAGKFVEALYGLNLAALTPATP